MTTKPTHPVYIDDATMDALHDELGDRIAAILEDIGQRVGASSRRRPRAGRASGLGR